MSGQVRVRFGLGNSLSGHPGFGSSSFRCSGIRSCLCLLGYFVGLGGSALCGIVISTWRNIYATVLQPKYFSKTPHVLKLKIRFVIIVGSVNWWIIECYILWYLTSKMTQQVFLRISDITMQYCNTICAMKVKADVKRQTTKHFKINNKLQYLTCTKTKSLRKTWKDQGKVLETYTRPDHGLQSLVLTIYTVQLILRVLFSYRDR